MKIEKFDQRNIQILLKIIAISLVPILVVYLPFVLHLTSIWGIPLGGSGMNVIFANWDGPNYVYNAITNYSKQAISDTPFLNVASYYPAHFPALSWLIKMASFFLGYFWGAITVQLIGGILLNFCFYYFIKDKTKHALWLTFAFTVFPPRYLAVRAVIGAEVWLVAIVMFTLICWERKQYYLSGVMSLVGILFKFQAVVLPISLLLVAIFDLYKSKKFELSKMMSPIIGLSGYGIVALYYYLAQGDANAYFAAQKIVGMSAALPFAMFNYSQKWVGTGWMETSAVYFIAIFVMIAKLLHDKKHTFAVFGALYTAMLSLIPQVDIMRLAMPLAPLFFYAFHDNLSSKHFRWGLVASLPAIYLFTINFIVKNQAPITNWSIFR